MNLSSSVVQDSIKSWAQYLDFRTIVRKIIRSSTSFIGRYSREDNTEVILYTDNLDVFADYFPQRSLKSAHTTTKRKVSFIATAYNELAFAEVLVRGIFNQTRLPDEIIITDTGSSDGTLELLEQLALESPVPMRILSKPGLNIAQGRNLAISNAQFPVIAVTDFGCILPEKWLENLITPFEDNSGVQVSFGRYQAVDSNDQPVRWILGWDLNQISPQDHLPSAVSISFLKQAWEQVGGYPEWLSMTGEDTYFALELKRSTTLWAFVPEADVRWIAPVSLSQSLRKIYRWSIGDGEAGTNAKAYRWVLIKLSFLFAELILLVSLVALIIFAHASSIKILSGILLCIGLVYAIFLLKKRQSKIRDEILLSAIYTLEVLGFIRGLLRRPQVDQRRIAELNGVFFILAGVPIDDTGGGARWTQITLELLRRQYQVFFINKFPKYESQDLDLDFRHPNLVTQHVSDLNWTALIEKYHPVLASKPILALVELPLADYLPLIDRVHSLHGVVIYDLLDTWDSSLGGQWYNSETEQCVINSSDLLIATSPGLVQYLESRANQTVHMVPNAVNNYLFNPERGYSIPSDFPEADWSIIYIGALWGEWFDWDLLEEISGSFPEAALLVIGDTLNRKFAMPENVHFLGLKPQRDLPAYLHHAQVAIVPWRVNSITQMTSPLKVYEYIAMYKPVVVPMLDPLKEIPGVFRAKNDVNFINMVGKLKDFQPPKVEMTEFIRKHNWQARVDKILELSTH